MKLALGFYILGYVLCLIVGLRSLYKPLGYLTVSDVLATVVFSILSWVGFVSVLIRPIKDQIADCKLNNPKNK